MRELSFFDYNFFYLGENMKYQKNVYSQVQKRNIVIHDFGATGLYLDNNMECDMIDKLYYLKAMKTAMLISQELLDNVLELFDSGKCQTGRFWHWKASSFEAQNSRKLTEFNAMLVDNSLFWKEEIFVAIEWQKVLDNIIFGYKFSGTQM